MPDIGRFFNIDPLADKYVYNSPYAFAENKLGMGTELEGLELNPFKNEIKKVENVVMPVVNGAIKGVQSVVGAVGDGIASVWNSIGPGDTGGGFTLNSENGGVTGGTDQGVREGQGDGMLEVGHLLTPDTRSDAINLVQGVEEETHIIQENVQENIVIENVTNEKGQDGPLEVKQVTDTVGEHKNFNHYKVTLSNGKDSVIQRTNNPEIKKDEQR